MRNRWVFALFCYVPVALAEIPAGVPTDQLFFSATVAAQATGGNLKANDPASGAPIPNGVNTLAKNLAATMLLANSAFGMANLGAGISVVGRNIPSGGALANILASGPSKAPLVPDGHDDKGSPLNPPDGVPPPTSGRPLESPAVEKVSALPVEPTLPTAPEGTPKFPPERDATPKVPSTSIRSNAFDALSALLDNDSRQSESRGLSVTERLERAIARERVRPAVERSLANLASKTTHRRGIAPARPGPLSNPAVLPTSTSPASPKGASSVPFAPPFPGPKTRSQPSTAATTVKNAGPTPANGAGTPGLLTKYIALPSKPLLGYEEFPNIGTLLQEDPSNPPSDEALETDETPPTSNSIAAPLYATYATNGLSLSGILGWIRSQLQALQEDSQYIEATSNAEDLVRWITSIETENPVFRWIQKSSEQVTSAIVEKTGLSEIQAATLYRLALATASAATATYFAWLAYAVAGTFLGRFGTTSSRGRIALWVLRSSRRYSRQRRDQTLPTI